MIVVFCPRITSRIQYVTRLVMGRLLASNWQLTDDPAVADAHKGPKIIYSREAGGMEGLHIPAHGFLSERGVHYFVPEVRRGNGLPLLFPAQADREEHGLEFDLFAAVFYLVSRYEEYLPHKKDLHWRFDPTASFAYRHNFLDKPVVNHYALLLKERLQELYPAYGFSDPSFTFLPTYDIDVAYAYRGRGIMRTFLGTLRSVFKLDFPSVFQRFRVLAKKEKDPFDTYDRQVELYKQSGIRAVYFFLCGDYGPYDKNVPFYSGAFFSLVKKINDYARTGIHPSVASAKDGSLLEREIARLEDILQQEICCSRQHYLKVDFPSTYQRLLRNNITHDFTMGYAGQPGFRASICTPYPFYDLETESVTPLIIVPFAVMDGTLRDYLQLTPGQALEVIKKLLDETVQVGGMFVSLWHNDSLSGRDDWQGWDKVYEEMYRLASLKHKSNYDPLHQAQ